MKSLPFGKMTEEEGKGEEGGDVLNIPSMCLVYDLTSS